MKPIKGAKDSKYLPMHKKLAQGLPINPSTKRGPKTPC